MILIIDNYDSFTYNLVDYFEQLGCETRVVQNDTSPENLVIDGVKGVVISPGPESPSKANHLTAYLPLLVGKRPLLGICLGHQALAEYFGAKLVKATKPMHGKISQIETAESVIFKGMPNKIEVVRYHSLIIHDLPMRLKPTAWTSTNELMAFEGITDKVHGIQFHPEAALTQYGLDMLRNWLSFYNIV